jgi:hypothetical protein
MPCLGKARVVQPTVPEGSMAKRKQKKEVAKGIDARLNNNDAELHQTEEAADKRARARVQGGRRGTSR